MVHNRQFMGGRPQLFRLDRDLSETENLADDHPQMLAEMVKRASAWEAQLVEPLWGKGSPRCAGLYRWRRKTADAPAIEVSAAVPFRMASSDA